MWLPPARAAKRCKFTPQAWISAHRSATPFQLSLQRHAAGFPAALAVGQVALLQKAATKLPSWAKASCILPARAYEQATSEALAEAKPWQSGLSALDLSCGLGSDNRAIAARYAEVIALEPDPVLVQVVRRNQAALGIHNVRIISQRAEDFIAQYEGPPFDLIYIDPDRRDASGQRQYGLRDCQPDVLGLLPRLLALSRRILIKASPMLDLQAVTAELGHAATLWVAAEANECKELLIEIDQQAAQPPRGAIFLRKGSAHTYLGEPGPQAPAWPPTAMPAYIYEADTALYKAGLAASWYAAAANGLHGGMVGHEGYFFADHDQPGFHGHRFKVLAQLDFKPAEIKKYCQAHGIAKIQYTRRDFDVPLEQVRQQVKVPEGGQLFLVLTRMGDRGRQAFVAARLSS
jgi:SAM-dependent methyltransferase